MSSMGSQFLRSKIEDDHLTCGICLHGFVQPKALPCLHSFCENCLRDHIESRADRNGIFLCPFCRLETQTPPNGVFGFPDNHLVSSLSDTVESSRRRPVIPPRPFVKTPPQPKPRKSLGTGSGTNISSGIGPVVNTCDCTGVNNTTTGNGFLDMTPSSQDRLYPILPKTNDFNPPPYPPPEKVECTEGMLLRFAKFGGGVDHLFKPFGLAVGKNGEIVVTDHGGNRILIYGFSGHLSNQISCDCIINGLAITKNNDILVTVSNSKSAIMRLYSMKGAKLAEYGSHYRFEKPSGVAVMPSGHTAVTGMESMCIYVFTEQYKFSVKFGRKGSGDEHFLTPYFVTTDSKGHIIVSDKLNHCIQMFDTIGKFKRRFGVEGTSSDQLRHPMGLCCDRNDNIIIADSNNHRVEIYSNKGKYLASVVRFLSDIGPGVQPINVAVTPSNRIVVLLQGPQFAEIRIYEHKL